MLSPRRTKFRKQQRHIRSHIRGIASRGTEVVFGEYGLLSQEGFFITDRQIEAARVAINRKIKRGGRVWIRIFPDIPYTKKPAETRMGKGKGNPEYWVAAVKPGVILFELSGVDVDLARKAMRSAAMKLPVRSKFIQRV